MKIIRIIARLNVGGPARHVIALTEGLQDDEFQTVLVAGSVPEGEECMSYLAEAAGVRPVYIRQMSRELSFFDVVALWRIYWLLRRERPTIVHTHTAKAGTVGRIAAWMYKWLTPKALVGRPRRVLVFHTFHGHVFHSYYGPMKTWLFVQVERCLARFATDKIIAISPKLLAEINESYSIGRRGQFEVIPLGIEVERYNADINGEDVGEGKPLLNRPALTVGFVGRLTEVKNISMYLRAASAYEALSGGEIPTAKFIVAGDGALRAELESEADQLGLKEIEFLGSVRDIHKVYASLDIVALTSFNEGTPLSLIEGMAASKPVISTLVGGVRDLMGEKIDEGQGFLVFERGVACESGDVEGFRNGLIYLAKSERLRKEIGVRGREFAVAMFAKERLVRDVRKLYRQEASKGNGDAK